MPKLKKILVILAISILSSLIAIGLVHNVSFLDGLERWSEDYRVASLTPQVETNSDIIVLGITEETLANFPYRSPIDRSFITHVINKLNASGAKAIGVDILFDQPTEPTKDNRLHTLISGFETPLVVVYADKDSQLTNEQVQFVNQFVPFSIRGFANLLKDGDGAIVRWAYPGKETVEKTWMPSFSFALAEKLGISAERTPFRIAWRNRVPESFAFKMFPAHNIDLLPAAWFKDKIILIGAVLPSGDRHRTPFSATLGAKGEMPGVFIHAHILDHILNNRRLEIISPSRAIAFTVALSIFAGILASLNFSMTGLAISFSTCLVLLWGGSFGYFAYYGTLIPVIAPTFAFSFAFWGGEAYWRRVEWIKRKIIRKLFSLYVSEDLVEHLLNTPDDVNFAGERRTMSYVFTDIANFTVTSENEDPVDIAELLNAYLDGICEIIIKHGGMVNDFIGDAVFAIFNAPVLQDNHSMQAIQCAKAIDGFSETFRKSEMGKKFNLGITRIGIHTGPAAIGNMGAAKRIKYTPIGDSVNTAARIEGLNKYLGTRICASEEAVYGYDDSAIRPVGEFILKGRETPLKIFEILLDNDQDPTYIDNYTIAYISMSEGNRDSKKLFEALRIRSPQDPIVKYHLNRLENEHYSAVIMMDEK